MQFRVSRFYQFKPPIQPQITPSFHPGQKCIPAIPADGYIRTFRRLRSNMTFFARSRSLRVLRPRRRFGTGEGDGPAVCRGGGSWRGTGFRVRVLARFCAKGELRVKILIQIERIANVKLFLTLVLSPRKLGEPFFFFWRKVH